MRGMLCAQETSQTVPGRGGRKTASRDQWRRKGCSAGCPQGRCRCARCRCGPLRLRAQPLVLATFQPVLELLLRLLGLSFQRIGVPRRCCGCPPDGGVHDHSVCDVVETRATRQRGHQEMASGDGSRGRKSTLEDNQLEKRLALLEVASFVLSHRIDAVSGHVGLCHTLPALSLSSVCPMNDEQGSRGQVLPAAWPSFKCATCTSTV